MNKFIPSYSKTLQRLAFSTIVLAAVAPAALAQPCSVSERKVKPEISTTVWMENRVEYATVSVNGKDVLTYSNEGESVSGSSEEKAQKFAEKLQEWIDVKHGSLEQLTASTENNLGVFRSGTETAIKFEIPDSCPNIAVASSQALNAIKDAIGTRNVSVAGAAQNVAQSLIDPEEVDTQGLSKFTGKASWYGGKFHGRRSASGERFDCNNLTAAHRTLPFGTKLLVRNRRTGNACVVKVSDRGPYSHGRVIDLSMGAAKQLNMISSGVAMVDVFVMN